MPTATASNETEHFADDKCVAALPLATEHTDAGVQGGVLPVDDALHRVGYGDFARNPPSKAPFVPESLAESRNGSAGCELGAVNRFMPDADEGWSSWDDDDEDAEEAWEDHCQCRCGCRSSVPPFVMVCGMCGECCFGGLR